KLRGMPADTAATPLGDSVKQVAEIHFDGWTLRLDSGELRRADRAIRLRPQSLQLLEELLTNPGEVVSREHLTRRLWPKGILDFETALNSAVRRLRKVLGDDAEKPMYIETIPRRGYRFIGSPVRYDSPVRCEGSAAQSPGARVIE